MDRARKLDLFLEVVQKNSFVKAANAKNIDPSVVSKQIISLERELGVRLLNRSTRSISTTDAGDKIAKQAEVIRKTLINTVRIAKSYHEKPKGLLRITSPTQFGNMYLQKAVHIFIDKYPDIDIKLDLEDKRSDLIRERFDIAFRIGPPRDSNLIARKLADNKMAILASQDFINKYGYPKTPDELIKLPSVIYNNGEYKLNRLTISSSPHSGVMQTHDLQGRFEVNDVNAWTKAVDMGLGYLLRPLFTLDRNIKDLGLVPLLTNYQLPNDEWGIYAVYPHRNPTPAVKLFIETVREVIGTPPKWESYIDGYEHMYK